MPLPRKPFATIADVAEYLGCSMHTLVQWAAAEMIWVQVPVTSAACAGGPLNGMVTVTGTDLLKAFSSHGTVKKKCRIQRVFCPEAVQWVTITDPKGGIVVATKCLMISVEQVRKFQSDHHQRTNTVPPVETAPVETARPETTLFEDEPNKTEPTGKVPTGKVPSKSRQRGRQPSYEWDDFFAALTKHIHDKGVPKSQAALVRVMLRWFECSTKVPEDVPDFRTVQRKVRKVYRLLRNYPPDD